MKETTDEKGLDLGVQAPAKTETNKASTELPANVAVLDTPVKRGEQEIFHVTVRKPCSGELRGLQLSELLQLDVGSLFKLLPRITELTEQEVKKLEPADLVELGSKVIDFLIQKRTKTDGSFAA